MPYKYTTDKIKMPREFDKRVKLTEAQREEIRVNVDNLSQRKLALHYGVSRRLISFIISPEKAAENLLRRHERGGSALYYDKDYHTEAVRTHRRYKQELKLKGKLSDDSTNTLQS